MKHFSPTTLLTCLLMLLALLPFYVQAEWHQDSWNAMGTRITVEFYHDDQQKALNLMQFSKNEFVRLENMMSSYIEASPLSLINSQATASPIHLPDELYYVIERSLYYSDLTSGAFDVTYASVGYKYDLRQHRVPTEKEISSLLPSINYRFIKLSPDKKTIQLLGSKTRIDVGGIAKGFAVDQVANKLMRQGVRSGVVTAGGDSRLIGDRQGRPWMIGIKDPRNPDNITVSLPLENVSISTSGDYERYFIEDGERYHHIISPSTGKSAKGVQSVTVIGADTSDGFNTTATDALSTSIFVLGVVEGLKLIERLEGFDVIIIDQHRKMHFSSGLMPPG